MLRTTKVTTEIEYDDEFYTPEKIVEEVRGELLEPHRPTVEDQGYHILRVYRLEP